MRPFKPTAILPSTRTMSRFSRSYYSSAARLLYNTAYSSSTVPPSPSSSLLSSTFHLRHFSESVERLRNVWISGLIDTDKMTPEERLLFYVSRINGIHELRGREAVEHMIEHCGFENYCTYCTWKDHKINIIDTPGPVNFTAEADRALRVFDGAILVLSSVGGVQLQRQSIIVDRQMRRYEIPRLAFIDKLDQMKANPWKVLNQLARSKLRHHSAAIQVPIGLGDDFKGLVDLVQLKAYYFHGEKVVADEEVIPADMEALVSEKRHELIEIVSQVDDKLAEAFFSDKKPISAADLEEAVRRATIARKFIPVFMGSALKNKGLQSLMDGVLNYLPCPFEEVSNIHVLDQTRNDKVKLLDGALVALAFKLDDYWFIELTYLRIYKGVIRKGDFITNVNTGEKIKVPCLFRMHSFEMKEIQEAHAGQIVAVFGAETDCVSGDTYTDDGYVQ